MASLQLVQLPIGAQEMGRTKGRQNPTEPLRPEVQTTGATGEPDSVFAETEGKSATFFL